MKPYDDKESIEKMIKDLKQFNELVRMRHEAGYERDERLSEFYLFGRWHLDTCGNLMKIIGDWIPQEMIPNIADVMEKDAFCKQLEGFKYQDGNRIMITATQSFLPRTDLVCAECGKLWDISNSHDLVHRERYEKVSLHAVVGQTLAQVRELYARRSDAFYFINPSHTIRNDRFINLHPHQIYSSLSINEYGWVGEKEGMTDEYIIEDGDELGVSITDCFHGTCNRAYLERLERQAFEQLFKNAGFERFDLYAIPNQYCQCDQCSPWYRVNTPLGEIVLGWRKRVIHIDWTATKLDVENIPDEPHVTHGKRWIHAWGEKKAVEYLRQIRSAAETEQKVS